MIADWYHAAILELSQLKDFQSDINWVASRLGITQTQAAGAIERLMKLNLLVETNKIWTANSDAYRTFSETPSPAIRKFHQHILAQAIESFEKDPSELRPAQSMIVAIPKNQLFIFEEKMRVFMQNFWEEIKESEKDDLYALSIHMTPARLRK